MQSGGGDTAGVSASLRTSRLPSSTTSRHKPTSSVPTTTAHAVAASIPAPTAIPQCPLPELRQDIPPPAPVAQPSSCTSPSRPQPAMSSQESEHGLPSPAPSHSPPTMQHRQLGQSADTNASGSLQTSREPAQTSVPTNNASGGAHVRIGISASPSAAAAGRNSVEQMGTQNGRKRSRDTSGEEACSGPNKRTMGNFAVPTAVSSTALPQQPPPFRRPSVATQPLPRPQPPRLINLEPLQVLNSVSPPSTQSPVNYSPCITAPPGYHGTASPVMQHMPSSVQSPVTQNFSPLQTPLPSPGQSPVQHNFTVSLASPAQLLNSITNFAMQFGGNTGRALTTGDINRLNIMRDAISKDDWSFMIAHQIYIARTLCTGSDVDAWAGGDVSGFGTVSGWEALKYYFRDNNELSGACLKFLLDFPLSLTTGYLTHPGPSAIVQQLRNLLSNGYKVCSLLPPSPILASP